MHTLTLTKQVTKDKGPYTRARLQIPLPKHTRHEKYHVILDDDAGAGVLYADDVEPWRVQAPLANVDPVGAGVGAALGFLSTHGITPRYVGITGSWASHEYVPGLSDVDILVIVNDSDCAKLELIRPNLPKSLDLMIGSVSAARKYWGKGAERLLLINAKPIIDTIGLASLITKQALDLNALRRRVSIELELLAGVDDLIADSEKPRERLGWAESLLLRLRGAHLVDCTAKDIYPTKARLLRVLGKYGITQALLKSIYVACKLHDKGVAIRRLQVPSKMVLLQVWSSTRKYAEDVKRSLA